MERVGHSLFMFRRALAVIYFVAFVVAVHEFVPLLGDPGRLPLSRFVAAVPVTVSPSLFYLWPHDAAFRAAGWAGVILSVTAIIGLPDRSSVWTAIVWGAMWLLYLSFVNVGQTFYGFGWETLLL